MNVFENAVQAADWINGLRYAGEKNGLNNMRALLARLGNPERQLRMVHVAGTNGKGSVCCMLSGVLRAAGYRVGLFTSPYIRRFHERIQANGAQIDDEELASITAYIRPFAEAMEETPTEFELITAIGFEYFRRAGVQYVVLPVLIPEKAGDS
jgi:dihydrofolate synthase/folylpolyglutamate synthase